jgi:hypothetical protein
MPVSFAIVHHANQFLITDGYDNREGIYEVLTDRGGRCGLARILTLHRQYAIPLNLHISGTLLEAIAWYKPALLHDLRDLYHSGLVEFVGSCYGQNIMRFFSYEYNLQQLNEELQLYHIHLGVDPATITTFWPPERVWETASLAPALNDPRLLNDGYRAVLLDDRILLPAAGLDSPRRCYDQEPAWDIDLFRACRIKDSQGLLALPIATNLRQSIPPRNAAQWEAVQQQLRWLAQHDAVPSHTAPIAIYADDLEKVAGIGGWDAAGPEQYEVFLAWLHEQYGITPIKLGDWLRANPVRATRPIETGTFYELAQSFGAGEDYTGWYDDPRWAPYRQAFAWAEGRVKLLKELGADPALIDLAEKHLLVSGWETAWHTPACGVHGDPQAGNAPSPWAAALASHSRHAALIAEAAYWMRHRDEAAHAYRYDIDGDGEEEIILKNDQLFVVTTPNFGGRVIALFAIGGRQGAMVIGNPSDDWNWQESLNRFMATPRNHPGALADLGYENDRHQAVILCASGSTVRVRLTNVQPASRACGMTKELTLAAGANELQVQYRLPAQLAAIAVDYGLSPDYLRLLRYGSRLIHAYAEGAARGWSAGAVTVWVRTAEDGTTMWMPSAEYGFGHGHSLRLASAARQFICWIGADGVAHDQAAPLEFASRKVASLSPVAE